MKKRISVILCAVLFVFAAMCFSSCNKTAEEADLWEYAMYKEDTEFGNGEKTLYVEVEAGEKKVLFTIHTDKNTVGEAMSEHKLISGDQGPYGLYIKKVNGITADYNVNKCYWSFNKEGEYMTTGVDLEEFLSDAHYELVYTKAD